MTPDELRSLADEATQRPQDDMEMIRYYDAQKSLIALAPDLARLCAELGEALLRTSTYVAFHFDNVNSTQETKDDLARATATLAKVYELNTGAEHPPGAERT